MPVGESQNNRRHSAANHAPLAYNDGARQDSLQPRACDSTVRAIFITKPKLVAKIESDDPSQRLAVQIDADNAQALLKTRDERALVKGGWLGVGGGKMPDGARAETHCRAEAPPCICRRR